MGFYKETQAFEQKTQIKSMNHQQQQENVRCIEKSSTSTTTKPTANILEASTTSSSSTIFASIKSLFTSTSIEHHTPYTTSSEHPTVEPPRSQRPSQSSGYHSSFTDSWDVDDSYVKVTKFSG